MLMFFSYRANAQSQFYLSEVWDKDGGTMPMFYKSASVLDNQRNVYVVGSTATDSSGFDILIQKFSPIGVLLWETTFDGGTNLDDYGVALYVDDDYQVFVTGAATQAVEHDLDLVVLKLDSEGYLLWTYFYYNYGSPIPYDGGTSITADNISGSVYVTGTSAGESTMMDYVAIKLAAEDGDEIWVNRYDYAGYNEIPHNITFSGSLIHVTGVSQSDFVVDQWEIAIVSFAEDDGSYFDEKRTQANGVSGVDEANDLTIDADGNIYIVGATDDGINGFNISLYKLNNELEILWEQHFDGYGLEDKGYGVKTDAAGNVYAVGYVTNPNQGKNYSILKYNSSGTLQWSREFNGLANQDDEAVQLVVRGDRIFVTGAARNSAYSDIVTMGYNADGEIFSLKSFENPFGLNDKPTAMGIDLDENIIIIGQVQQTIGVFGNVTIKYNALEKPIIPVYIDSVPAYNQNELIIRFDKSAMKLEAVDKKNFDAGELQDFVHKFVIDSLNAKLKLETARLPTFKIFRRMTTADSLSITRLGDTIPVPAFWATLSVMLPDEYDLFEAIDSLNTMKPMVHYGEVNGFIRAASAPNDPLYDTLQKSLHPLLTPTPNPSNEDLVNHINVEGAWEIVVGNPSVKVGVFDEAIYWQHEDFYVDEVQASQGLFSQSKINGGYHFYNSGQPTGPIPIQNFTLPNHSHGTAVAGIIGAVRNNNIGIAGIAGGDVTQLYQEQPNTGVSIYSYGILLNNAIPPDNPDGTGLLSDAYLAIAQASLNTTAGFGDGIHIQNHSWATNDNSIKQTLNAVIKTAWKNHSIIVAARGNNGIDGETANSVRFPACIDDIVVINVSASGTDGKRVNTNNGVVVNDITEWHAGFGHGMDFLAPGSAALVSTLVMPNDYFFLDQNLQYGSNYGAFNGTSAAAPHVSGVAALMYSLHNTLNNLTGEDIEHILQKSTYLSQNHSSSSHYGIFTSSEGFGIINAALAVEMVDYPNYFVRHSKSSDFISTPNVALVAQNVLISLGNDYINNPYIDILSGGSYVADRYEATWQIQVTLPSNHEIIDFWPLFSKSCAGYKHTSDFQYSFNHFEHFSFEPSLHDIYNEIENIGFGTNTLNTITVKATYYFVKYPQNQPNMTLNRWLPECGTNNPNHLIPFSFSLHIRENDELSTPENQISQLQIFPNPTENTLNLKLSNQPIQEIVVFDLLGRVIFQENKSCTSNNSQIDVSDFSNGIYIVQVMSAQGIVSSSKFIKK
jgi:subtilisin family serine protease